MIQLPNKLQIEFKLKVYGIFIFGLPQNQVDNRLCDLTKPELLPTTHADGWSEIKYICNEVGIATEVNATEMRYRTYTAFANMEIPKSHRVTF